MSTQLLWCGGGSSGSGSIVSQQQPTARPAVWRWAPANPHAQRSLEGPHMALSPQLNTACLPGLPACRGTTSMDCEDGWPAAMCTLNIQGLSTSSEGGFQAYCQAGEAHKPEDWE